ncbi:uncharacterized protein LOC135461622 [Liolophura sinensis]|uniref:uncharacterized protein LOC135461622 n=1 Tax=Liolophura sinensis TaxID=3198878 RepID=UPI003158D22F
MEDVRNVAYFINLLSIVILTILPLSECYRRGFNIPLPLADPFITEDMGESELNTEFNQDPSSIFDNGALPLVLRSFEEKLVHDLQYHPGLEHITETQAFYLRERLRGLYSYLKNHPALMDRRLQVASRKPLYTFRSAPVVPEKRTSFPVGIRYPVCPSRNEWRLIYTARDINNTAVELFQPQDGSEGQQWFYTVSCDQTRITALNPTCPSCCTGIDHRRFSSECLTMKSYVIALVKRQQDTFFDWNWIKVESSCSCAITRKHGG